MKKRIAFICVHNSCRSQIAEALGKHLAADIFESYSAGTETKPQINQDAVRIMKELYGIDMEQTQYSKLITDIPDSDVAISMGCNVGCPFTGEIMEIALVSADSDSLEESGSDENQNGDLRTEGIINPYENSEVTFSNLTSEEDQSELRKDLEKAGIKESYIKDYIDFVNIYNETAPKSVLNGWNTLDKVNYDPYEIADVWVEKCGYRYHSKGLLNRCK